MSKAKSESLIAVILKNLREKSLSAEPGAFLGSESDFLSLYNVSRPTFRQAAKIAHQEHIIEIRVGVKGGFYARRPDVSSVLNAIALFLRSHNITGKEQVEAFATIYSSVCRIAARKRDPELLTAILELSRKEEEDIETEIGWDDYIQIERYLVNLVGRLTGNPIITLLTDAIAELNYYLYDSLPKIEGFRARKARQTRLELMRAILAGDARASENLARRWEKEVGRWLMPVAAD